MLEVERERLEAEIGDKMESHVVVVLLLRRYNPR